MGIKAGCIKIDTVWPFPEEKLIKATENAQKIIVAELNLGQVFYEVQRILRDKDVVLLSKIGGEMQLPEEILEKIKSV